MQNWNMLVADGAGADQEADADIDNSLLGVEQAEEVQAMQVKKAALQAALASCKAVGHVQAMRGLEVELKKECRREREMIQESPAIAEAFLRRRKLENQEESRRRAVAERDACLAAHLLAAVFDAAGRSRLRLTSACRCQVWVSFFLHG